MQTAARRRTLRRLLARGEFASQQELVERLQRAGFEVTQATVSRDLNALGAVKARGLKGGYRYLLAEDAQPRPESQEVLSRVLTEFAEQVDVSGNLVVIHTPPGAAQVVAGALDGAALPGLLGTVAGDDTVLVVANQRSGGQRLARRIEEVAG